MSDTIRLAHGFGGKLSYDLLQKVILPALGGTGRVPTLDAAVIDDLMPPVVVSTDSYTITPRFFPGGDIGKLAVAGTVNDLLMMGAKPAYLSLGLILEEGFSFDELRAIMASLGDTCRAAGMTVVTGDTKVVEHGAVDGLFINTTGFGTRLFGPVGPSRIRAGDAVLVTGTLGDHGAAILNVRERLGFSEDLRSDCAPLHELILNAAAVAGGYLHALRDPTRGGVAATLNEFVIDAGLDIVIREEAIPVNPIVASFVDVLGLDVLTLANEGKALLIAAPESAERILAALKEHPLGSNAAVIGTVEQPRAAGEVILETAIGTRRIIDMPLEAGLPRIC